MKSEVTRLGGPKPPYPYIGIHDDGSAVLFINEGVGVAVAEGGGTKIGTYHSDWAEGVFIPLVGELTLSND